MTDWDWIVERIESAMRAVDAAHEASESLQNEVTPQNVDAFTCRIEELCKELSILKQVFNEERGYTVEELTDVLAKMLSGGPASYRRTPRYEVKSPGEK
jgi:hypothetical protein